MLDIQPTVFTLQFFCSGSIRHRKGSNYEYIYIYMCVHIVVSPFPVLVTKRIFTLLVLDPNLNLHSNHITYITWKGDNPKYINHKLHYIKVKNSRLRPSHGFIHQNPSQVQGLHAASLMSAGSTSLVDSTSPPPRFFSLTPMGSPCFFLG